MEPSNGFSEEDGFQDSANNSMHHHDLANSIKQMLKVGNHSVQQQNGHSALLDGSGDAAQSNQAIDEQNELSESLSKLNLLQGGEPGASTNTIIELGKVEDGKCVQISKEETKIIASLSTEIGSQSSASNKVKISTITKFEWERKYYAGNLVSVTNNYIAYGIHQGRAAPSVRVINRVNASDRVLLKGFSGFVCDVAFAHNSSNMIGALDCKGNLIIWSLDQVGGNMTAEKKIHIQADDEMLKGTTSHRFVWIPHVQTDNDSAAEDESNYGYKSDNQENETARIFVLTYSNVAEVWDLDIALNSIENFASTDVKRSDLTHAYVKVDGHTDEITDCELSPIGNVLASASCDGFVKFWQIQIEDRSPPTCLHRWKPHNGKAVSCVKFCDDKKQSELSVYWRFLLTGCERNSELKLWCTVSWNCLQVIKFAPSTPAHAPPEFNVVLHTSSDFLVLSDIHRNVLYVMQCKSKIEEGQAQLTSIAQYHLTSPLLSMAFVEANPCRFKSILEEKSNMEDNNEEEEEDLSDEEEDALPKSQDESSKEMDPKLDGVLIKVIAIQPRSLQSLDVRFFPNEGISDYPSPLSTYNTISEDIKDMVSISSIEDNLQSTTEESSPDKTVPEKQQSPDLTHIQHEEEPRPKSPTLLAPHGGESAPDVTRSTSPPVLLTPDAFMGSLKSSGNFNESQNTSFTAVTPFSNNPPSQYQSIQDNNLLLGTILNPLSSLGLSSSPNSTINSQPPQQQQMEPEEEQDDPAELDVTATPPSSPVVPRSTSSPPPVSQILASFVKSPDLISSTSTQEPMLSNAMQHQGSHSSSIASVDNIPSIHLSSASSSVQHQSWPKAPDVTMSRPLSVRSPPPRNNIVQQNIEVRQRNEPPDVSVELQREPLVQINPTEPIQQQAGVSREQEIIDILTNIKKDQIAMRADHQKDLQTIHKKQNQLHQILKNHDNVNKKSEQQGDRIEKSMKSLNDLPRKLSTDIKNMQTSVNEVTTNKLDRIVKNEMKKTVLPGVVQSMDPIKDQLNNTVCQKLTAVDAVLKENIGKMVKSKEVTDNIAHATAKAVQGDIQAALPDIFFQTVIPSFERSSQLMLQQLSTTYHRGMEELVGKLEKSVQFRLKPDQDRFQSLIKEATDVTANLQNISKKLTTEVTNHLQKTVNEQVEKTLARCEERIINSVQESIKQQETTFSEQRRSIENLVRDIVVRTLDERLPQLAAENSNLTVTSRVGGQIGGARPILQRPSVVDQQQQILKMLQQGNVNTAFQTALTAADLTLVMYVCETVDPAVVFGVSPCPLQQPILLSLIQQLSSDLATKTDIKLKYLQEAVMNLDRRHQVTQEYMHSVLSALVQKLQSCAQGPLEIPSIAKDLKMLAMAAQSLMK